MKIRPFTTTANSAKRVRKLIRRAESIPTTFLATGDYVKSADRSIIMSPLFTRVRWNVCNFDKFNRPNISSRLPRDSGLGRVQTWRDLTNDGSLFVAWRHGELDIG
jgi:hypothetical protein